MRACPADVAGRRMSGAGPTGVGECPRIHTVLFRQTPAALVERWRPLSVPPAFAERYRMRSWFHFLPICLLLLFRPGSGRPDRTPGARRRRRLVSLYRLQGRPHPGHERGHRAGRLQGLRTRRSSSIPTPTPLHEAGPERLDRRLLQHLAEPAHPRRLPSAPASVVPRGDPALGATRRSAAGECGAGAERTESRGDPRL